METTAQTSVFTELAEFFASQPSLQAMIDYKVSPAIQEYLNGLLEKNREEGLSAEEKTEVERMLAMLHLITLVKLQARKRLAENSGE
jgi:hypothetical protein